MFRKNKAVLKSQLSCYSNVANLSNMLATKNIKIEIGMAQNAQYLKNCYKNIGIQCWRMEFKELCKISEWSKKVFALYS